VLLETEVLIVTLFPFSFQKGPNKYFETKNPTISVFIFFKKKKKNQSYKEFENSTFPSLNEHYENRV
jgi:hypothetical protein